MRGIEIPAGAKDKKNSGGFYVANSAVFTTDNPTRDWDMFTAFLGDQLSQALQSLKLPSALRMYPAAEEPMYSPKAAV